MIRIPARMYGLSVERIWFPEDGVPVSSNADILRYLRVLPDQAEALHGAAEPAYTLLSDLTLPEDTLLSAMNKNYRYEVRRAQKEDVAVSVYDAADLRADGSILTAFEKTYMDFCESLGNEDLKDDFDREKIASYVVHDCILLTKAEQGNAVVFHLYVTDGLWAVLCYSASDFRDDSVDRASAGRMNKLLHWRDMLFLKGRGCRWYDWGNVSDPVNYNGIDTFKAGFGGAPATMYNLSVGNNLLGKVAVAALRCVKR